MTSRLGVQSKSGRCILLAYWGLSPVRIPPVILFHQPPAFFLLQSHIITMFWICYVLNFLFCFFVVWVWALTIRFVLNAWRMKQIIGLKMISYFTLTSYLLFLFSCWHDAVMLAKKKQKKKRKENVKSCIIYEICIKEKCNSIINKILIQFLEPVVRLKFVINV